jgi:hypothetical protein
MKLRTYSVLTAILLAIYSFDVFACDPTHPGCVDNFTHDMELTSFQGESARIYFKGWDYGHHNNGWGWIGAGMRTMEFTALDPNAVPQKLHREGYCVDIPQGLNGGQYKVELKELDANSSWHMDAAWMMHNIVVDTAFEAAAMQLAIWEVVYDGISSFDPNKSLDEWWGGNFRVSSWYSWDLKQEALSYLGMLVNATDYSGLENYRIAKSCDYQDMIVTPIPAAVWLMGSGLFGLVAVGRRRSSKES